MKTKIKTKSAKKPVAKKIKSRESPPPAAVKTDFQFAPVLCLVNSGQQRLWGMTSTERLIRQFAQANLTQQVDEKAAAHRDGMVLLVHGDAVIDQPLIGALLKRPNFMLLSDDQNAKPLALNLRGAEVPEGLKLLQGKPAPANSKFIGRSPAQMDVDYWQGLRKRETPYAMLLTPDNQPQVEWRMFMGTYKGATDFVTKHVWPVPAFYVTRWLASVGATPNLVTTLAAILTVLALYFFLQGQFWAGLAAGWAMTFLDTVDGKLARTTLTSSKWGDYFDHGLDLLHPPFWYAGWAIGLSAIGIVWSPQVFWPTLAAIIGGYVLQRLIEGIAIKWLAIEIHIWRPVDTFFRQITARRNPNLAILTLFTLFAKPDWGLVAVALWTIACLLLHAIQLAQAFAEKRHSGALVSWLKKP